MAGGRWPVAKTEDQMQQNEAGKYATIALEALVQFKMDKIKDDFWESTHFGLSITRDEKGLFVLDKAILIPGGGSPAIGWWPDDVDFVNLGVFNSFSEALDSAKIEAIKIKFVEQCERDFYAGAGQQS